MIYKSNTQVNKLCFLINEHRYDSAIILMLTKMVRLSNHIRSRFQNLPDMFMLEGVLVLLKEVKAINNQEKVAIAFKYSDSKKLCFMFLDLSARSMKKDVLLIHF